MFKSGSACRINLAVKRRIDLFCTAPTIATHETVGQAPQRSPFLRRWLRRFKPQQNAGSAAVPVIVVRMDTVSAGLILARSVAVHRPHTAHRRACMKMLCRHQNMARQLKSSGPPVAPSLCWRSRRPLPVWRDVPRSLRTPRVLNALTVSLPQENKLPELFPRLFDSSPGSRKNVCS